MRRAMYSAKKGSALLIAILVMGILITLTLGLSNLVIREISQTTDVVSAGKAYFAAEAGIENALLDLHENLPGYETQNPGDPNDPYVPIQDPATGLDARYRIQSKADPTYNNVPSFDSDKPVFLTGDVPTNVSFAYSDHPEATYKDLPLSESAVIPLYSANSDGTFSNVTNFLIEYYVDFTQDEATASQINSGDFKKIDILRWKIFGKPDPNQGGDISKTDSISDFFPSTFEASASFPMCIGTDQSLAPTANHQGCQFPALLPKAGANLGPMKSPDCGAPPASVTSRIPGPPQEVLQISSTTAPSRILSTIMSRTISCSPTSSIRMFCVRG